MMVAVGVLALLVFVLCGVVYELFRDVRQLRDVAGILDRPLHVELGAVAGTRPSSYGLPEALDSAGSALVLFLSDRCSTCRSLAAGLGSHLPPGLWVVLEARSPDSAAKFIEFYELTRMLEGGRLSVDIGDAIAGRIGLDMTPVGFRVEDGRIVNATTVPSQRYLSSILPKPIRLRPAQGAPNERGGGPIEDLYCCGLARPGQRMHLLPRRQVDLHVSRWLLQALVVLHRGHQDLRLR